MSLPLIALLFLSFILMAYHLYGSWIEKKLSIQNQTPTTAHTLKDDQDFVPTPPFYLFGQHFSAIAAAGPIAGPIIACQTFGWLPCLLWIALGVVFIGAVHDFASLTASVKHKGSSIAEMVMEHMGTGAGRAMMFFIWITLVYVIVAFSDITASGFVSVIEELQGSALSFNAGGAVAGASLLYLLLAMIMGLLHRYLKPNLWVSTLVFVPAIFAIAWIGPHISHIFLLPVQIWIILILLYCAIASLLPVWLLLQPRGYLGGFVLYFALLMGIIGIFFGGYEIQQPFFKTWDSGTTTGALFPFLFVTIACGACSGFHGLVCSGTTSKQIDRESHMKPVGYGAMLAEGFVAFMALAIIMITASAQTQGLKPGTIYGNGIGRFLTLIIGEQNLPFAITFGAMAFSTFVFDTIDVATRLGRYLVQEVTGLKNKTGAILGTVLTAGLPALILLSAPQTGWQKFWILFGSANQLLAALTLLFITVWLKQQGKHYWFTLLPMLFVLVITLWSLLKLAYVNFSEMQGLDVFLMNGVVATGLILLAIYLVIKASFLGKSSHL